MGSCPGVLGRKEQRVNEPLCTGMNGGPDEGNTHQLALMTSHFLLKQSLPLHTHTHMHAGTCLKNRRMGLAGAKVNESKEEREMIS